MKPFIGSCHLRGIEVDHYTSNAICPRCHSDIRQRFLIEFIQVRTNLLKHRQRVLHFAPEISIYKMFRQADLDYVAADVNPSQFVEAIYADITDIPFGNDEFDFLICIHVLEHIYDDVKAISEIYRVLKRNASAIIAVPIYGDVTYENPDFNYDERELQYGTGDHLRLNGLDFADKLRKCGFNVETVSVDDVPGNFVDHTIHSPHIESDKFLFFCTKPAV
jgi:SAM-dependent methyltransferase